MTRSQPAPTVDSMPEIKPLRKKRSWLKSILFGLVTIVVLWIALLARDVLVLRADVLALQDYAQALPNPIQPAQVDMTFVAQRVSSLHGNLSGLRIHAVPLLALAPALGWIPQVGGDIQAAPALLQLALQFTSMGQQATQLLTLSWPLPAESHVSLELGARVAQLLQPAADSFRADLDRAAKIRSGIDTARVSPRLQSLLTGFDEYYPALESSLSLLKVAPQLLGVDRPRTYLILFQNEDELRGTGGFISAVGKVTLDAGKIISLTVEDAYQIDNFKTPYPEPPAPLRDYMGLGLWVFRDSNWSPDFPSAAQEAIKLYTQTRGGSIDGVIALNQKAVEELASGLGPLPVDPQQPPVSAQDIRTYMRAAWTTSAKGNDVSAWYTKRKAFIGQLLKVMLDRITNGGGQVQWAEVGRQLDRALQRRDLLIAFTDPALNQALHAAQFDGALREAEGDYVLVADSNLGYNKANAAIQESLAYTITLEQTPHADLTVVYTHTGQTASGCVHQVPNYGKPIEYDSLVQRCYWNYRRIYVPLGAQLIEATRHPTGPGELITGLTSDGATHTTTEDGKTVFGTLLIVPRGQRVESHVRYDLPSTVLTTTENQLRYRLTWQKQSGMGDWPVRVTVTWPDGYHLIGTQPPPIEVSDHAAVFQFTLDIDHEVLTTLTQ